MVYIIFKGKKKGNINRILILRMGSMGDTITAIPAFASIRKAFPEAQIDLLTNKYSGGKPPVSEIVPETFFSCIYNYERFVDHQIASQLKNNKYDLYIELPTYRASLFFELRSILLAKKIRAGHGIGWHVSSDLFLRNIQERILEFDSNSVRLLEILRKYHLKTDFAGWKREQNLIKLPIFDTETLINSKRKPNGYVALVPGAGASNKKWGIEKFKFIANWLTEKDYDVMVLGGIQDNEDAAFIARGNENIFNLCGKLKVLENAVIMKKCVLTISNDTGLMHLAYASGVPVIVIFGRQDYEGKWNPPEDGNNLVIRGDLEKISAEDVIYEIYRLLFPGKTNTDL